VRSVTSSAASRHFPRSTEIGKSTHGSHGSFSSGRIPGWRHKACRSHRHSAPQAVSSLFLCPLDLSPSGPLAPRAGQSIQMMTVFGSSPGPPSSGALVPALATASDHRSPDNRGFMGCKGVHGSAWGDVRMLFNRADSTHPHATELHPPLDGPMRSMGDSQAAHVHSRECQWGESRSEATA